ncbi:Dehydrogenase [Streptomyces clavuligerus]|uniref:Dehydrogenase n=6 Tax=Streptomyces clavuligerus TaxID=1901 RepID=E2Q284_STRCL|nr:NADH-quinone oxidoreductase subunit C [Streptomyces clavuligerus]EFG08672.1 Dehydrogenase [Streptomyces clavuligerus]
MNAYDGLPDSVTEVFGPDATAEHAYDLLTVDVPADAWISALTTARDRLGCTYFDWLSAVDEPGTGFRVCAHVVSLEGGRVRRLLLRTTVPHEAAVLPTAVGVYAGAGWHERETHEMFGVGFTGHPHLVPLLLPEGFEGHPLRKDFVLAARVAKAWPGAKEPGESEHGGPKRRQMLPPGVPDPNEWGPLKGQLPAAPARTPRTPRTAPGATPDRPARRTRTTSEGSASQAPEAAAPPRRTRSAAEGSASQPAAGTTAPRRTRSAADGSAGQAPAPETQPRPSSRPSDAPWHHARPAFDTQDKLHPDPTDPAEPTGPDRTGPAAPAEPEPPSGEPPQEPGPAEPTRSADAPAEPAESTEPAEPTDAAESADAAGPTASRPDGRGGPRGRSDGQAGDGAQDPQSPYHHDPAGGDPA